MVSGCRSVITWSSASPSTTVGGRSSTQMWYAVTGLPLSEGANHDTLTVVAVDDSCTCDITAGHDGGVVHRAARLHGPAPASFTAWKPFTFTGHLDCVQNLAHVPFLSPVQQSGTVFQVNSKWSWTPAVLKRNLKHIFIIKHSVLNNSRCFSFSSISITYDFSFTLFSHAKDYHTKRPQCLRMSRLVTWPTTAVSAANHLTAHP